ncbi:hypothetical protein BYT27DRAFT_7124289 [Phlegmacium glaucopus]|nr:hypothetical protein BYT27DRAFT_7124289 [Phlegmacium glaucopus]
MTGTQLVGCQTQIQPEGEQDLRICPRCHNATVFAAKSTTWFELFWIPLVPISKKHMWVCGTCQWRELLSNKWVESRLNAPQPLATYNQAGTWASPARPGYQPVYINPTVPKV